MLQWDGRVEDPLGHHAQVRPGGCAGKSCKEHIARKHGKKDGKKTRQKPPGKKNTTRHIDWPGSTLSNPANDDLR